MKKRKESFWGLHFDFHATPKDGIQGKTLKEEDIRKICHLLKPDFIQIDCKGHPGYTSYPSKLGNAGSIHADSASTTDDYIPPVLDIKLSINAPNAKALVLQPEGTLLPMEHASNGRLITTIPRIDIHSIIEICE